MYKTAIVRRPARSSVHGLTSVDLGNADYDLLLEQYENYTGTLADLGLKIIELDPLEDFPDAYFTEDTAIVIPEVAVVMRPGAEARRGETAYITDELGKHRELEFVSEPGTIDGGDVLIVNKHCIVGLSERTSQQGAEQLCSILEEYGYKSDIVDVPEALHFKSSVNFVDENTLLVTQTCYWLDCLSYYRKLVVQEGEEYSANVAWINGTILMPAGYPGTRRLLSENGFQTIEMPVSEISKMDGGLTCLSLRLT